MLSLMKHHSISHMISIALFAMLTGCATQLAPPYDTNLTNGLNELNSAAMTLLASTSNGTNSKTFPDREATYNTLIGNAEALALSSRARPMPRNKVTETINAMLEKRDVQTLTDDMSTPPSAHAIQQVADTFAKMKDVDRKQGITVYEAQAFKGQVGIYLEQAITYENFLQR